MAKLTKKDLVDLMAHIFLLAHNGHRNMLTRETYDILDAQVRDAFNHDEEKALKFILNRTNKLVEKMVKANEGTGNGKVEQVG